ncbi:MAG: T9SS type A sorting domain-containing protein [Chitinophagaceae bacterium]
MKPYILFIVVSIGLSIVSFAQQASPAVIASGGGTTKTGSIYLDWTLGELAIESIKSAKYMYTQGFHQPVLVVERIENNSNLIVKNYSISVFPNPATSILTIQLHFIPATPLSVSLFDGHGKLILRKKIPAISQLFQLNVGAYAQGAYYLQIQNTEGSVLSNYNVIKTQ